jgi:para-nitrobenzyl esterase
MKYFPLNLFLCLFTVSTAWGVGNEIQVTGGAISGGTDNGTQVFKGIPFAAPPIGDLRWKPPHPVAAWDGTRVSTEFGPACPQPGYPAGSFYKSPGITMNEDCLYLNVWTDADSKDEKRPVMVWIHGGALTRGAGSNEVYNGANLAKKGVVLVTVNYRLGPLGYLAHPELTNEEPRGVSGNYGVLDQIASLRWVQTNIAQFGGDPNNVTIFGESAGSWSVHALVGTPLAKGLFHRAIGESGGLFGPGVHLASDPSGGKTGHQIGADFLTAAGASTIAEARALSAEKIIETFEGDGRGFTTRPIVDGWAFPDSIHTIFQSGRQNDIPVMVGSNAKEWTTLSSPASIPKSSAALKQMLARQYKDANFNEFGKVYGGLEDDTAADAYLGLMRDVVFSNQMRLWARATEDVKSDAYLYYFTRVPPIPNSEYYGAFHAAEISYAFQNTSPDYEDADRALSDTMSDYWVNFAATGNPNGEGVPEWKAYDSKNEAYQELGDTVGGGNHLLKEELDYLGTLLGDD